MMKTYLTRCALPPLFLLLPLLQPALFSQSNVRAKAKYHHLKQTFLKAPTELRSVHSGLYLPGCIG